ncbi:HAMP domain-containing sensor histidine kinase [Leptolyngbya sp. AN02str]|uniref:sensor histidine kinase n=1 Tax=Leptolyngbya sp. AN02str TaxID=3423363 RepID=UPI003D310FC7
MSLRVKLLVGFSVVFSLVFAGVFYWFYEFTTDKVLARLKSDMRATLMGAIAGVNVDELMALYAEGQPNADGFSDDPRYLRILAWFETVHNIEPRAWIYSYAIGTSDTNRRIGAPAAEPGELEIIYLVDLWSVYNPSKAARFLEPDNAGIAARRVLTNGGLFESSIYSDKWGTWISAFAPLKDRNGQVVAVLGLDIDAGYVRQLQNAIRGRVLLACILTYIIFFGLIYILSGILTRHLRELTRFAEQIAVGDYRLEQSSSFGGTRFPDEMNTLSKVFLGMVENIRIREQIIREGKRAEDEMRLALEEERELNELKSRFISMVSHELRTPLTVIRTSLELLDRYGHLATEEKRQHYFQRSRIAVENMNQLIEDVLMIGKAEACKLDFSPTLLELKPFCKDVVEEVRMGIGHTHRLAFTHTGNCSEAYFDPKLLRSILTNLLSNAFKYSPSGSTVKFTLACDERLVTFEIQDEGIGIPTEDQPRLFELFHRASNVNAIRGTGLGLAIVRQCVAEHGGSITFESQEGKGTTFTVRLPVKRSLPELEPLGNSNSHNGHQELAVTRHPIHATARIPQITMAVDSELSEPLGD